MEHCTSILSVLRYSAAAVVEVVVVVVVAAVVVAVAVVAAVAIQIVLIIHYSLFSSLPTFSFGFEKFSHSL